MKKTAWFPGDVKPKRKGIYQRRYGNGALAYSKWNGDCWLSGVFNICDVSTTKTQSWLQSLEWRGLTTRGGKA